MVSETVKTTAEAEKTVTIRKALSAMFLCVSNRGRLLS